MIKIELNKIIEVNKEQFNYARNKYPGFVAYRTENGKFYIKFLTLIGLNKVEVEEILNKSGS